MKRNEIWLGIGVACLALGSILVVGTLTFSLSPTITWDLSSLQFWATLGVGLATTTVGVIAGLIGAVTMAPAPTGDPQQTHAVMYQRYLVGVGYALLLIAVLNAVALAGLAKSGVLGSVFAPTLAPQAKVEPSAEWNATMMLILISLSTGILGALFFIANSLREKRDGFEEFKAAEFWGGLWYRLGEAVLFTVVVFFLSKSVTTSTNNAAPLPLIALFLGMFVKTGERLIFGAAKRVFAAAQTLVPLQPGDLDDDLTGTQATVPGMVRDLKATLTGSKVLLTWKPPSGPAPIVGYRILQRPRAGGSWTTVATSKSESATLDYPPGPPREFTVLAFNSKRDGPEAAAVPGP
jgi:hypothetical protein